MSDTPLDVESTATPQHSGRVEGTESSVQAMVETWKGVALKASDRHAKACDYFERLDSEFGLGSTVLAAVVGSAVFVTLQDASIIAVKVVVGGLGVTAAIASGIQTTAKYGARAERHRQASRRYGALVREISEMEVLPPAPADLKASLDGIRKALDEAGAMAPDVPPKIWDAKSVKARAPGIHP